MSNVFSPHSVMSMTGFASIQGTLPSGRVFGMAIKSVNHRHLDLLIRVPNGMDALEAAMRTAIKAAVRRGHVELTLIARKERLCLHRRAR